LSKIEWTRQTWNPIAGCSVVSAGCTNCYAMRQAYRLEHHLKMPAYAGTTKKVNGNPVWTGTINRASDASFEKPLRITKPSLIFVNSMSDLFHEKVRYHWLREIMGIIDQCPQHQFQILTKRPSNINPMMRAIGRDRMPDNVWLGTSVEDHRVKIRIDHLREVRASIRYLSCEPLIGPLGPVDMEDIHWVIGGGESGPGARPCMKAWAVALRWSCQRQGVPFLWKQWGTYQNNPLAWDHPGNEADIASAKRLDPEGKGGSLLDGQHFREMPSSPLGPDGQYALS